MKKKHNELETMGKRISTFILATAAFLVFTSYNIIQPTEQPQKPGIKTIVIDAGHGGKDVGARGAYSYEADITLAISLKLEKALKAAMPDVKIVMTRTTDVFDAPQVKAAKANAAKGDLFVCVHVNSAPGTKHKELTGYKTQTYYSGSGSKRKKYTKKVPTYRYWTSPNPAKGTETYIWGIDKNDDKEIALRENESLYIDSVAAKQVGDFNPESPEKVILYSLKTQQYFSRSVNLAMAIEDEFKKIGRISREVKQRQKGIWVLQATAMPSVLIETGYISNPEEEDYLNSESGQHELASAIVKALKRYRQAIETNVLITSMNDAQ